VKRRKYVAALTDVYDRRPCQAKEYTDTNGGQLMTFDQAKVSFRVSKNYETACAYLAATSQGKAAIDPHAFFDAVGEVANWLSAPDKHLFGFGAASAITATWNRDDDSSEGEDDA
jgi:hypothetical protein